MARLSRARSFWAFRRHSYNKIVPKAKELESRLQRTEQQLQLFQKVSRFMVRELSLQEVLQGIVSLVVEFAQCDSCLVYLLDSEELVLVRFEHAAPFHHRQSPAETE